MRSAQLFVITAWVLSTTPHATAAAQHIPDDPLAGLPTDNDDDHGRPDPAKSNSKGSRSCRLDARPANSRDVGDLRATLAFVTRGPQAWTCPPSGQPSDVRLRVTVNVDGRITEVESVGDDPAVAAGLAKRLVGQSITPRPEGATQGTVVLSFAGHKK